MAFTSMCLCDDFSSKFITMPHLHIVKKSLNSCVSIRITISEKYLIVLLCKFVAERKCIVELLFVYFNTILTIVYTKPVSLPSYIFFN